MLSTLTYCPIFLMTLLNTRMTNPRQNIISPMVSVVPTKSKRGCHAPTHIESTRQYPRQNSLSPSLAQRQTDELSCPAHLFTTYVNTQLHALHLNLGLSCPYPAYSMSYDLHLGHFICVFTPRISPATKRRLHFLSRHSKDQRHGYT